MKGKNARQRQRRTNTNARLIRKQARGFQLGEWMYLFGDEQILHWSRPMIGSFQVIDIFSGPQDDTLFVVVAPYEFAVHPSRLEHLSVYVPSQMYLHRIAPDPLAFVLREQEDQPWT
jgi:hypothetical protein